MAGGLLLRGRKEESKLTCDHRGCRCAEIRVERDSKGFCSEHCAEKENLGPRETSSHCGHPGCAAG